MRNLQFYGCDRKPRWSWWPGRVRSPGWDGERKREGEKVCQWTKSTSSTVCLDLQVWTLICPVQKKPQAPLSNNICVYNMYIEIYLLLLLFCLLVCCLCNNSSLNKKSSVDQSHRSFFYFLLSFLHCAICHCCVKCMSSCSHLLSFVITYSFIVCKCWYVFKNPYVLIFFIMYFASKEKKLNSSLSYLHVSSKTCAAAVNTEGRLCQ